MKNPEPNQSSFSFSLMIVSSAVTLTLGLLFPLLANAEKFPIVEYTQPSPLPAGSYTNESDAEWIAFSTILHATNATSVRVRLAEWQLEPQSYLRITSLTDGGTQCLNSRSLGWWQNTSAWFNGSEVRLDLVLGPGDSNASVRVKELVTRWAGDAPMTPESLCNSDDRVSASDNRVGRLGDCTAWLVSNGAVLTAGHCAPSTAVFEVNVPSSLPDGTTVMAQPQDQYPPDPNSWTWFNNGNGDDWAIFRLFPNGGTGQLPHASHGFFRMTKGFTGSEAQVSVMGFGTDNTPPGATGGLNTQNQTLQSDTGPYLGSFGTGNAVDYHYRVDTESGNDGSPIISLYDGYGMGVHTTGGCNNNPFSYNLGTSFENAHFASTLENFYAPNTRYVDNAHDSPGPGSVFSPWTNLNQVVQFMPAGGVVSIVTGTYPANQGNAVLLNKPMKIIAPVGPVILGH
jgi:hypothetical protein